MLVPLVCTNANILCAYFFLAGRYFMTSSTGELYIRSVKADDNLKKFACQTTNKITRERKISEPVQLSIKGIQVFSHLTSSIDALISSFTKWYNSISEVTTNMAPTTNQKPVLNMYVDHGSDIHLPCSIYGNPLPVYA